MLAELREDNKMLAARCEAHNVDEHRDIASSSLIENWIDETEAHLVPVRGQSVQGDRALSAGRRVRHTDTRTGLSW